MNIQEINDQYRDRVNLILQEEWNCPPPISRGRKIDTTDLPEFLCLEEDEIR
jgi:hypothetical protein